MLNTTSTPKQAASQPGDFIRALVAKHLAENKYPRIHTRFPPEPNGYLHIGHAKSICLNFGIAREFNGVCNLRMDDTNPTRENVEFVDSIREDVNWLISGWADDRLGLKPKGKTPDTVTSNDKSDFVLSPAPSNQSAVVEPFYASDYFEQIYEYAVALIKKGAAYVCDLSPADTNTYRGAPDRPGKNSPFRNRTIEENLDLFTRMKRGEFPNGARTLRAKIDMASPNIWMRDPVLYRIRHAEHHHTGNQWSIYPMYDFAHCLSDYIEGITHSVCTLEFEVHRALYDWILENLDLPRPLPHQYEFSRLNLAYTVMSKRKLMTLVTEKFVSGWNDPRLPTISGIRRRGITPHALRTFVSSLGITKYNGLTQLAVFEHTIRKDLNARALRRFAVLRPLKVVITNLPEGVTEEFDAVNNPEDASAGSRKITFSRTLYIEQSDYLESAPADYSRLKPGGEVRLKYAYIIKCDEAVKDAAGNVIELRCTADLGSKVGGPNAHRKVKAAIHWVSAAHAVDVEVRLYDRLFTIPEPDTGGDFKQFLNPNSLEIVTAKGESSLHSARPTERYQFERLGYFTLDTEAAGDHPVFIRTITLRDQWAKAQKANDNFRKFPRTTVNAPRAQAVTESEAAFDEVTVKGKRRKAPATRVNGQIVVASGKSLKMAAVKDEWWLPGEVVEVPEQFVAALKQSDLKADIFTFGHKPPDMKAKFNYAIDWDNVATIPISTFADWWQRQITPDVRQNIKKAWKGDVLVKPAPLDDELFRGITAIYNETPLRQGKPFYHYGKDFETVKKHNSTYAHQTEFIGAYFENELIGFIQLNFMGQIADIKQLISKNSHYDKKPGNALIAKAVEICEQRGISQLLYGKFHYYGNLNDDSLAEFKKRHGFVQVAVPRYYIPLTLKGRLAMLLRLHLGMKRLIPEPLLQFALGLRAKLFQNRRVQRYVLAKHAPKTQHESPAS